MKLFEGFEKLITEHGSVAALKERIDLVKEQHVILERKCTELESALAEAHGALEAALEENRLWKAEMAQLDGSVLSDVEVKILIALSGVRSDHEGLPVSQLSRALTTGEQATLFYLTDLEKAGLVGASYSSIDETVWSLAQDGRRYLVERGLAW